MVGLSCVTFDCRDPSVVARFWADALRWELESHRVVAPDRSIYLEFVTVPDEKVVKNRLHLGLHSDDVDAEVDRLVALGASVAWEEEFPPEWPFRNIVLRDPEGNEFCLGNEGSA